MMIFYYYSSLFKRMTRSGILEVFRNLGSSLPCFILSLIGSDVFGAKRLDQMIDSIPPTFSQHDESWATGVIHPLKVKVIDSLRKSRVASELRFCVVLRSNFYILQWGESILAILACIRYGKPKFNINIYWVTICNILTTFWPFFDLRKKYDFIHN